MEKHLLFLTGLIITILLQSNTFCQISLNANGNGNYFGAGATWHQYSGSNVSMNIGIPSGTQAQTWTAPTFSATDSLTTNYILPASSPYASYFQAATYTSKISSFQNGFALDSYQYIKLSNDILYIIGEVMHYYGSAGGHTVDTVLLKDTTYITTILPIQRGASYSTVCSTAAAANIQSASPKNFMLNQNYPNPFNPATTISFQIPKSSFGTLKVYDALGREVATLINEQKSPGTYSVNFNGSNLSSEMYLYRLQAGDFVETKKLTLLN